MYLEPVREEDVPLAMEIINMAKKHLKEQGIDQWQDGYPNESSVLGDISQKKGYFAKENQRVLGYISIDFTGEPAYQSLNTWDSEEDFVVVHRFALHEQARGKGVAGGILSLVEEECKVRNITYFRIDTHEENLKMRRILERNGFTARGVVMLPTGERIGFDKRLK